MKRRSAVLFGLIAALAISPIAAKTAHAQTVNCTGVAAWSPNSVAYAVGNLVTYNGSEYKCQQAHTSQAAWDPADAASLWVLQGTCASTTGTTTGATCAAAPSTPTGLAASGTTSTSTNLSWTAVTPPANCTVSYTVYKGGASIGTASSNSFSVTGLSPSTAYTFTVQATDSAGSSAQSSSVGVTTTAGSTAGLVKIACGNSAVSPFVADVDFSGGAVSSGTTTAISTAGVTNPAPAAVYQHGRKSNCTYTIPGLTAGTTYQVRLHFAEYAATAAGQRTFNVSINGTQVLTNFDIFATAGGEFKANVQQFNAVANSSGQIVIVFTTVVNNVLVSGIEVNNVTASCTALPAAPGGLAASGTTSTSTNLSWNSVSAPANCNISGYAVYRGTTQIATVSSGTSYTATGLTASTAYTFTVAAIDAAGTGPKATAINVTTSGTVTAGPIKNAVIGYWDNWGTFTMPNTSMNYNVINYAFAVGSGTDGATMVMWTPSATNPLSNAAADIAATKAQGRKVILSLGGATSPNITLLNQTDINNFVSSVESCVDTYGFQGIDLDFENGSVTVNSGDSLTNPTTPDIHNLSTALHTLKSHYGSSFIITYVPETADIDAYAAYGGLWGGYLALIGATRDILTFSDTQCYNSGSMNAANGQVVSAGTADFLVAMSELLLHGYTVSGGQTFAPLSPSQVAFGSLYNGTPASTNLSAWNYLTKGTADGGSYHLLGGPYPNMAGVMCWDINGDAGNGYAFANAMHNGGLTGN